MTDKVQKIRAEIIRRYNEYMAKDSKLAAIRADECLGILSCIDSMQEEPVSEELEEAIGDYCSNPDNFATWIGGEENDDIPLIVKAIKFGAKWKEQQMTKKAIDGQLENGEDYLRIKCLSMGCQPQDDGKLVKLIIIKEDRI